jgi:predicted  nucleic acid-binding Zn-ribbon protein
MAWFLNFYRCARCRKVWTDEWSCMCDDECPYCGFRDMTPFKSEDLTEIIEQDGDEFVAIRSPASAEDDPDYQELGRFPTRAKADEFLASFDPDDL